MKEMNSKSANLDFHCISTNQPFSQPLDNTNASKFILGIIEEGNLLYMPTKGIVLFKVFSYLASELTTISYVCFYSRGVIVGMHW